MKTFIFFITLTLATFASADDLQSIKLDYLLQQQQGAVAMQTRQIAVLADQITALKQQQAPVYTQQPRQVQRPTLYVNPPVPTPGETDVTSDPTYSGDKTLLDPAPAPQQPVVTPVITPTQYQSPQYNQPMLNVAYMPYNQPMVNVAYQQPRYRYVPIPTAVWPQRYVRVQY